MMEPQATQESESNEIAVFSPKISTESKEKAVFIPKTFVTRPKNGKRRKNRNSIFEDSTAKSSLFSIEEKLGLKGLFEGPHNHLNFDCPKPLAKLFKEATRHNGTSICKELQKYALSYVVNYGLEKQSFGSTLSKVLKPKLTIENLNFEQYVQSRPRRLLRRAEVHFSEEKSVCGFADCKNEAIGRAVWLARNQVYRLCEKHLDAAKQNPKHWKILNHAGGEL